MLLQHHTLIEMLHKEMDEKQLEVVNNFTIWWKFNFQKKNNPRHRWRELKIAVNTQTYFDHSKCIMNVLQITNIFEFFPQSELNKELEIKQAQLQKAYLEMKEKNKENGVLCRWSEKTLQSLPDINIYVCLIILFLLYSVVNISVLQSQLRNFEKEKESEKEKAVATVSGEWAPGVYVVCVFFLRLERGYVTSLFILCLPDAS